MGGVRLDSFCASLGGRGDLINPLGVQRSTTTLWSVPLLTAELGLCTFSSHA